MKAEELFIAAKKPNITGAINEGKLLQPIYDMIGGKPLNEEDFKGFNEEELEEINTYVPMYQAYLKNTDDSELSHEQRLLKNTLSSSSEEESAVLGGPNQGFKLKPDDRELGVNDLGWWLSREEAIKKGFLYYDEKTRVLSKYPPDNYQAGGYVMNYGDYGRSYK